MYKVRVTIFLNDTSVGRQFSYVKFDRLPFVPVPGLNLQLAGMDEELIVGGSTWRECSKNGPYFDVSLYETSDSGYIWWDTTPDQIARLKDNGFATEQEL